MTLSMCPSVLGKRVSTSKQLWIPGGQVWVRNSAGKRAVGGALRGHRGLEGPQKGLGSNQVSDDLTPAAQVT